MMRNILNIALAQLSFQPSYVGINGSYIDEPILFEATEKSILSLPNNTESKFLKKSIRNYNLSNLKVKLESVLDFCAQRNVNLVVFPEYAIPVALLPTCYSYSVEKEMIIIAGSHSVINNSQSFQYYQDAKLIIDNKLGGIDSLEIV